MMKFTMHTKELKNMIEKALTVVPKKVAIHALECVKIEVSEGTVFFSGTDLEMFLVCKTDKAYECKNGKILVDGADLKMLTKLAGEITIEEEENTVKITAGKKTLRMGTVSVEDFPAFPEIADAENLGVIPDNDFLDAVTNLSNFLGQSEANKMLTVYNLNFKESRIYASDGHVIGWKNLSLNSNSDNVDFCILGNSLLAFKKVLNVKSTDNLSLSKTEKYIQITGTDFTYIQRRLDGKYFDFSRFLNTDCRYSFDVETEDLMEAVKYDCTIAKKTDRIPLLFSISEKLITYYFNGKYEVMDNIEISNGNFGSEMLIGFNPFYWQDILSVADANALHVQISHPKAPALMNADKYGFLLLPVNLDGHEKNVQRFRAVA